MKVRRPIDITFGVDPLPYEHVIASYSTVIGARRLPSAIVIDWSPDCPLIPNADQTAEPAVVQSLPAPSDPGDGGPR